MCVADQKDPDIAKLESEFLDAGPNQWNTRLEIAVDEDVALRTGDEIISEAFAADVVQIAGDMEWRKWLDPIGIGLSAQRTRESTENE
jgi:hypothetical protein